MRSVGRRIGWQTTLIVLVLIIGWGGTSQADPPRRQDRSRGDAAARARQQQAARARQQQAAVQAATAQLKAAKEVLAAAESTGEAAQAKLNASLAKLKEAAEKSRDAQSTTRHLAKELAEIEEDILEEQTENSPFIQASQRVETARTRLSEVEQRILAEPDVKSQLSGLESSKLGEIKASILKSRTEYQVAKADLDGAGSDLARIRSELFQGDKDWKEAAEALTKARAEERAAEAMTHSGASGRAGATQTVKNAAEAAAAARVAIAQAERVIKLADANRKQKSPAKSSPKSKNKK
jgi:hypothetical protein